MKRDEMPKKTKQGNTPKWLAFGLTFIGSLAFLIIAFSGGVSLLTGATGIWQPLLYAAAVLGSLTLFLMNFGNMGNTPVFMNAMMRATLFTTFALVALTATAGNQALFLATIISFILCFVGSGIAYMA